MENELFAKVSTNMLTIRESLSCNIILNFSFILYWEEYERTCQVVLRPVFSNL